jgi:precorrin-6B methylase 2
LYNLDIDGHMMEVELQEIERLAAEVPANGLIVEVGCLYGRSTYAWAKSCDPSVKVIVIDPFYEEGQRKKFDENTAGIENIEVIDGKAPDKMIYPGHMIDLIFIDATHYNPNDMDIIEYFLPFVKTGGILSGHDYYETFPDVTTNVRILEERLNQKVINPPGTSIWAFRV